MFIDLVDSLRCVAAHEESWLVAAVARMDGRQVVEAHHLCMMMRGVEKQNSKTITSALLGTFRDDAKTRDEFLRLAHGASSVG